METPGRREGGEGLRGGARRGDVPSAARGGCTWLALLHAQPGEGGTLYSSTIVCDRLLRMTKQNPQNVVIVWYDMTTCCVVYSDTYRPQLLGIFWVVNVVRTYFVQGIVVFFHGGVNR